MTDNTSTGTCERCAEPFQRTVPTKRFCSERCRAAAEHARRAAAKTEIRQAARIKQGDHTTDANKTGRRSTFACRTCGDISEQRIGRGRPWAICRLCARKYTVAQAYKVSKTVKCKHCRIPFTATVQPSVLTVVCAACKGSTMRLYHRQLASMIKDIRKQRATRAAGIYLEAKCNQCHHTIWLDGAGVGKGQRTCGMRRCQNQSRYATQVYQDSFADKNHRRRSQYKTGDRIAKSLVWERDMGMCHICNEAADRNDWHLDHITPLARGGTHTWDNVAVSHASCNLSKGSSIAA